MQVSDLRDFPYCKWSYFSLVWNGLNLADIAFPWFVWMIGVSIVLSQRSLRTKKIRNRSILFKICRRTAILFLLGKNKFTVSYSTLSSSHSGLAGNGGKPKLENLAILGVLQRLALCYFVTAVIVLFLPGTNDEPNTARSPIGERETRICIVWKISFLGGKIRRHWRIDLFHGVFQFWLQWLCILLITIAWLLITFFLDVPNCPKGYLGPGGKHEHGKYQNCTGGMWHYHVKNLSSLLQLYSFLIGAARIVDQFILKDSHMGRCWTCRDIYSTQLSFEPEG